MLTSCRASVPIVAVSTRMTQTTATVIVHVITNDNKHEFVLEVIETFDISDHYGIFCQINNLSRVNYFRDTIRKKSIPHCLTVIDIMLLMNGFWI